MKRTARHYAQAIAAALDAGNDLSKVLERLKARLRKDRARKLFPRIIKATMTELEVAQGIQAVAATVARAEMKTVVESELTRRFAARVVLAGSIQPTILGGAVVRVGDTQVDGTIVRSLTALRTALRGTPHTNQSMKNHDETE